MISRHPPLLASLVALTVALGLAPAAQAADWPQWLGPQRNGHSTETGSLVGTWGSDGPPTRWSRPIGTGFSAISVVGNTGYTMATDGPHIALVAFDVATGKNRWSVRIGQGYD
ncbi:MAG: hypothetical protein QF464_23010, partial [Myxococcota bacterium]|nr:hypothetical protein [Myxococcota bacterium]